MTEQPERRGDLPPDVEAPDIEIPGGQEHEVPDDEDVPADETVPEPPD